MNRVNMDKIIKGSALILLVFLSGCEWDFRAVETDYRGVFDYKPQAALSQTITAVIEGDIVRISSSNNSVAGTAGTFQAGTFYVSSAVSRRNTSDGAYTYALYSGTTRIGYFNTGKRDVFYIDEARQDYFIRRGSNVVVEPEEPEDPEGPVYY
jgi:hypothetical protein